MLAANYADAADYGAYGSFIKFVAYSFAVASLIPTIKTFRRLDAISKSKASSSSDQQISMTDGVSQQVTKDREDLGKVQLVVVERSFLLRTISTITTDEGTYRVYGDVKSVRNGELVSKREGQLWLGVISEKRNFAFV